MSHFPALRITSLSVLQTSDASLEALGEDGEQTHGFEATSHCGVEMWVCLSFQEEAQVGRFQHRVSHRASRARAGHNPTQLPGGRWSFWPQ